MHVITCPVIDWESAMVIDRESAKTGRPIREAVSVRKSKNMNRGDGSDQLSHAWDKQGLK